MPFCSNCGAELAGDASFCPQCGTPATKPQTAEVEAKSDVQECQNADESSSAPAPQAETITDTAAAVPPAGQSQAHAAAPSSDPEPNTQVQQPQATAAAPQSAPAPATAPQPSAQPAAAQAQSQPQPVQTNSAPPQQTQPVYAQGCVSAAWGDITKSKGWFGKVALMALINFIPILNWIIPGYCMRWSRQLVFGKVQDMPKSLFCNRAFVNGVFAFVIGLVIAIILWICNLVLGFIPFLGWIAIIVLAVFAVMFEYVCYMRAAVADSLGAGFQFGKIWDTFTRNLGSLFCAAVLPNLIIGIITGIVVVIVISIGMAFVIGGSIFDLIDILDTYSYYSSSRAGIYAAQLIIQIILSMIPAIIIAGYLGGIGTSLSYLLTFRAMGHWVSRYASDWVSDPMVTATAHTYDVLEVAQQAPSGQQPGGQQQPPAQQ